MLVNGRTDCMYPKSWHEIMNFMKLYKVLYIYIHIYIIFIYFNRNMSEFDYRYYWNELEWLDMYGYDCDETWRLCH